MNQASREDHQHDFDVATEDVIACAYEIIDARQHLEAMSREVQQKDAELKSAERKLADARVDYDHELERLAHIIDRLETSHRALQEQDSPPR